jgi:hypothetical protein
MGKIYLPSPEVLEKARNMGRTLATTDTSISPDLTDVEKYPNYVQFLLEHRKKLEKHPRFWTWEVRLAQLIEDEQDICRMPADAPDAQKDQIAVPVRCAFWFGWETVHNLQKRYDQIVIKKPEEKPVQVDKESMNWMG